MGPKVIGVGIIFLLFSLPVRAQYLMVKKRDWIGNSPPNIREGDLECFSEYMELWIHRMRIEGLKLWLSGTLRIPVSLASLDQLNLQLSVCGFSLHRDTERNYIFRVMYSGCFVQQEHGDFVILLNLQRRVGRFGGRTNTFVMKCPVVTAPPSAEHIHCNPNFISVTRKIPQDSWNNKLRWSLALRGKLVVALEDASLIQLNTEINGSSITVQGKRRDIMSLEMVMGKYDEFLPLKLVSGHYAYSMEASCPSVSRSPAGETVLHIFKRRMGLTKRGGYDRETLSISDVSVTQTDSFSVSESRDFVELAIPTSSILQTKNCTGPAGEALLQTFFRVDAVLTFKEMPHKVNWSMENFSTCTASLSPAKTQAQDDPSPVSRSPLQPLASTSDFHTTIHPPMLLTPTNLRPFAETVARETTSGSGLLSSGEVFGSTGVTTLAAEVLPGVASQNVLENTSHVTSVSPGSTSAAPSAVAQGTYASADPDLRPLPQLESGPPASELHSASLRTVEGAPPTPTDPRASGAPTPRREVTGQTGSASAPPQSATGLRRGGLSVGPTEGTSQEDEGAFTETAPHSARMEDMATEEQEPKSLNAPESTQDSLSETRGHTWEWRLMKTSAPPLTSSPPNERDREVVATPPASPSPLHSAPFASEATEDAHDRERTRSVATPPVTASGQRLPSDVQAGGFANTPRSVASVNGTNSPQRTLNSSDSLWTSSLSKQDAPESTNAWVNRTESP